MARHLTLAYGVLNYLMFLAAFLYAIGFVGDLVVPRSVDHGPHAPPGWAIAVDVVLLGVFAGQHSVMARPAFKRWLTRAVPEYLERSTYVLASNLVLALLFWQWRPIPALVWDVTAPVGRTALWVVFWLGWVIALVSTFLI